MSNRPPITPAMIEAGAQVLAASGYGSDLYDVRATEAVREVLEAVFGASERPGPPYPPGQCNCGRSAREASGATPLPDRTLALVDELQGVLDERLEDDSLEDYWAAALSVFMLLMSRALAEAAFSTGASLEEGIARTLAQIAETARNVVIDEP